MHCGKLCLSTAIQSGVAVVSPLNALQLYIILVLSFIVGVIAVSDHPEWFNGGGLEAGMVVPTPDVSRIPDR